MTSAHSGIYVPARHWLTPCRADGWLGVGVVELANRKEENSFRGYAGYTNNSFCNRTIIKVINVFNMRLFCVRAFRGVLFEDIFFFLVAKNLCECLQRFEDV